MGARIQYTEAGAVQVKAHAKINLFLHITGRRDDGYHFLESVFAFTEFGDDVIVETGEDLSLQIEGPMSKGLSETNNLVLDAAIKLAEFAEIIPKASITLVKNLPVASGVGGGSADAAATLVALNHLWKLALTPQELSEIALSLGADVPACLHTKPLILRGVGELVDPTALPTAPHILLVNPNKEVSTPEIVQTFKLSGAAFDETIMDWPATLSDIPDMTTNSLQNPAIGLCADILAVINALKSIDGVQLVRMSGSGATCFAIFDNSALLQAAAKQVKELHPNWWVQSSCLIA